MERDVLDSSEYHFWGWGSRAGAGFCSVLWFVDRLKRSLASNLVFPLNALPCRPLGNLEGPQSGVKSGGEEKDGEAGSGKAETQEGEEAERGSAISAFGEQREPTMTKPMMGPGSFEARGRREILQTREHRGSIQTNKTKNGSSRTGREQLG